MANYSYTYIERHTGDEVEVSLPATREEAQEIYRDIMSSVVDKDVFLQKVRLWTASDLYILGLFCSWWHRRDLWTGRADVDCDFQFEHARHVQFHSDFCVNTTAREHGKSTWLHTRVIQAILRDPEVTIGIFSFDRDKGSQKHLVRIKNELESNKILQHSWPEVLWQSPKEEAPLWSMKSGIEVKRKINSITPTVSALTFMTGLPTGSRYGIFVFDDVETEETVATEERRTTAISRIRSALNMAGRGAVVWIAGTFHHTAGPLATLIADGWDHHYFAAEDVEKEPPDIAALYDACGGVRPDNGAKIPIAVRDVQLDGEPVFLHPLECAMKRFQMGVDVYNTQNMSRPLVGKAMRFDEDWVAEEFRVKGDLWDFARGKYGYILTDTSRGGDPYAILLLVAGADKTLTLVDAIIKKGQPTDWTEEVVAMWSQWRDVVDFRQIRVERFGQSTHPELLKAKFDQYRMNPPPIYGIGTRVGGRRGGLDLKLVRIWQRCQPLFKELRIRLPAQLTAYDENNKPFDVVEYFLAKEYRLFPAPARDDVFDALALLGEPPEKVPPVEYPEDGPQLPAYRPQSEAAMGFLDEESFLWTA